MAKQMSYYGFSVGDRVTVRVPDKVYDSGEKVKPGDEGVIRAFPPKVVIPGIKDPARQDKKTRFAYVQWDDGKRGGVDLVNLVKVGSYLRSPDYCPFCRGEDISASHPDIVPGGRIFVHVKCIDCEKEWSEIYNLVKVEGVDERTGERISGRNA